MIELHPRIVALLQDGFNCAGDDGFDPFTEEERVEVEVALRAYHNEIVAEYSKLEEQRRERERRRGAEWRERERVRLQRELDSLR